MTATMPKVGEVYDLSFPVIAPNIGIVRVRVAGADDPPRTTPCGAPKVPVQVVLGQLPRANPDRVIGPGEVTTLPIFLGTWTRVPAGGGA